MNQKGTKIALLLTILAVVFSLYHYLSSELASIYMSLFVLSVLVPTWWLGIKYDNLRIDYQNIKVENEKLTNENLAANVKNKEFEMLFNTLEDTALFIYDPLSLTLSFSKGTEKIFGYSHKDINNNFHLWKSHIHTEDYDKVKDFEKGILLANSSKVEFRVIHPENGEQWVSMNATPIVNENGTIEKIIGQCFDITKTKLIELELKHMAFFDELTDLPNRKMLDRHIQKALSRSKRHNHNFTVMFADLDEFKAVNDTFGHDTGDMLLKEVVTRLHESVRDEDIIARIGGDEFILVFEETSKAEIEGIASRMIENISSPYNIQGNELTISLSLGVSMYPDDGEDKETLLQNADKAMYYAKNNGKNNYKLYNPDLEQIELKPQGIFEKWMSMVQKSKLFKP